MFIIRVLIMSVVIYFVPYLLPGFHETGIFSALFFSLVLGVVNGVLRPILIILTLPLTLVTVGIFLLFINAFTFWLASTLSFGIHVDNFATAFWGGFIVGVVSLLVQRVFNTNKKRGHS
jgi:putative membrane protein